MREFLQEAWLSILGAVCLVVGCLLWAMQTWAAPYLPVIVYILGAAALVGYGVYMRRQPADAASETSRPTQPVGTPKNSVMAQVAPLVVGALVCGLWLLSPVRSLAAGLAAELDVLSSRAVSADPSPAVRASACQLMLEEQRDGIDPSLQQAMSRSAKLADDCLKPALAAGHPAAKQLFWRTKRSLADRLMSASEPLTQEQACKVAERLAGLQESHARIDLLECSLGAPAPPARACCTDVLGAKPSLDELVGPPEALASHTAQAVMAALTERVFFPSRQASNTAPSWATPANRRWLWGLACQMASGPDRTSRRVAEPSLGAMTHSLSCGWSADAHHTVFASLPWPAICPELNEAIDAKASDASICPVIRPRLAEEAVETASRAVHAAIGTYELETSAADVAATPVGAGSKPSADEAYSARIDSMSINDLYGKGKGARPDSPNCRAYLLARIPGADRLLQNPHFAKMQGSTIDCSGPDGNTTFGQVKEKLGGTMAAGRFDADAVVDRAGLEGKYGKRPVDAVMGEMDQVETR